MSDKLKKQRGASDGGMILAVIIVSVICSSAMILESCVRSHKDAKVEARKIKNLEKLKRKVTPYDTRTVDGYIVRY